MSLNQTRPTLNPFSGEFQLLHTIDRGITIRHQLDCPFIVKAGTTRINADAIVPEGMELLVEETGEWLVL